MLSDRQIDTYCDVLLWALRTARTKRFRKGDIVLVRCDLGAVKMAEILQAKLLDAGMNPVFRLGMTPKMEKDFFTRANTGQLVFQLPGEKDLYHHLNGSVYLLAPDALTHLAGVDSKRIGKAAVSRKPLRDILDRREEKGEFGWTLCMLPTRELAKQAGLSVKQYETQVIRACYLDEEEPVRRWRGIFRDAMAIKKWLNPMAIQALRIESDHIDLLVKPGERRRWVGMTGHNIPSFEIFLSPDWRGTEGVYYANQPSYRNGNYVEGVRLVFRNGSVVKAEAAKGETFVREYIGLDKGAARVGEFSLTDKRFSRISRFMANTLYDENYGGLYGNCHIALGSSYSDSYSGDPSKLTRAMKKTLGFNDSAIHWDLVNTENKRVTARLSGGEKRVIYEKGMFRY
jgi:aminopeptidase